MAKYFAKCFLVLIFLISPINLCIITSITIYSDGSKKICLIGEEHNGCYTSDSSCAHTELRDTEHMLDLAQSSANCKKHVTFCLEETIYALEIVNKVIEESHCFADIPVVLGNFFIKNNGVLGNATFVLDDMRGAASWVCGSYLYWVAAKLPDFWQDMIQRLPQVLQLRYRNIQLSNQNVDEKLNENPLLRETLFSPSNPFANFFSEASERNNLGRLYTVGELFQEWNNNLNELSTRLNKLDKNSALYKYLKGYKEFLVPAVANAHKFFMESTGNDPETFDKSIGQCIFNAIITKTWPFSYCEAEYHKWTKPLKRMADIGFALTIEKALSLSDMVILYAGDNHCNQLEPFLKLKQFAKIYVEQIETELRADGHTVSLSPDAAMKQYFVDIKNIMGLDC